MQLRHTTSDGNNDHHKNLHQDQIF